MPFDGQSVPTPIADALRRVLDGGKKWCKWTRLDSEGRHCILGALDVVTPRDVDRPYDLLAQAVLAADPENRRQKRYIEHPILGQALRAQAIAANFNNSSETTYADIERAIDAFADIERQRALVNA